MHWSSAGGCVVYTNLMHSIDMILITFIRHAVECLEASVRVLTGILKADSMPHPPSESCESNYEAQTACERVTYRNLH